MVTGARVFVSGVAPEALASCGHPGIGADADVPAERDAFVDAAVEHLGGLVNNPGIAGPTEPVEQTTPGAPDATLRIDLASMSHCSRRAIPALRAAGISEIEMTDRTAATMSLRCVVSQQDVANRALYRASPFGATISGQAINTDADMQKTM